MLSRKISIVIPAYNEELNIKNTLNEIIDYLKAFGSDYEILVVDDGSTDSTKAIAEETLLNNNGKLLKNERNMGKGAAIKKGMLAASGAIILFMDADNSTSIKELDKFLPYVKEFDVVIGSRRIEGSDLESSAPAYRVILGNFYVWLSRILIKSVIRDYNCGFKLFKKEAARIIFSKQLMNDWSYDTEDIFLAEKFKFKIKEVPVKWVYRSTSKVKPLRDGIRSFASLLKIKTNDIQRRYED